jgi:hypothetical protein
MGLSVMAATSASEATPSIGRPTAGMTREKLALLV